MRRVGIRLAMAAVGLCLLAGRLGVAFLGHLGLRWLWLARPDTPTLVAGLAAGTLLAGDLSYRFGTARLLSAIDAREVGPDRAPALSARVERLAGAMGLRTPRLYVARLGAPDAMAIGGARRGAIVVDRGLPRLLNRRELDAIPAHGLAHLRSHDGLIQPLAYSAGRTLVAAVSLVALPPALALAGLARGTAWLRGRPTDRSDPLHCLRRWLDAAVVVVPFAFTSRSGPTPAAGSTPPTTARSR